MSRVATFLVVVLALASGPAHAQDDSAKLVGGLELKPRGFFIVNASRNGGTLNPGSFVFYALPPAVSRSQFFVSPANTVLGFGLSGLSIGDLQLSGGLDVTLRSPQPLAASNVISPQFYDVHIQLESGRLRLILGQYLDVLLPFVPDTTNSFPSGYLPGAIGYARPQVRGDARLPFGEEAQLILKVAACQPIQTFDLPGSVAVGRQGGVPDGQARASVAIGRSKLPWERPFELGLGGHLGKRRVTFTDTGVTQDFASWSVAADLHVRLPFGTELKFRIWRGRLVGDYAGGIFQTVDVGTRQAVHARGLWFDVRQHLSERWRVAAGYGWDDPRDSDLSAGARTLNQAGFANVFWDMSKTIGFALEGSRWATSYLGQGTTTAWRADSVFMMRF
jgi:hypothetical protein